MADPGDRAMALVGGLLGTQLLEVLVERRVLSAMDAVEMIATCNVGLDANAAGAHPEERETFAIAKKWLSSVAAGFVERARAEM